MTRPCTLRGAPGLLFTALLVAVLSSTLLACGPATRDAVLGCTLPAECGPGARCVAGACQASTPPTADFTLPAALTTNRPVAVTAVATDPDPGDAVAAWAWTITRLTAACDADVDVEDAATLQAVFWCAGTYEVALTVTDAAGAISTPVRRTTTVALLGGAPSVSAGPPVAVDHRCAGAPLRCELTQPVLLAADGQAPLGGPLTFRWTAFPPDASRAEAASYLSPSAAAQAPALSISTGGGAISGSWRLRVRAEDVHGNLAQAFQVVTVGNRPPVLDGAALALDHRYEGGAYLAGGPLAVPVSDPDGDPVEVDLMVEEPAGSGCTAGLTAPTATGGTYALRCPSPAGLMAPVRTLVISAADANGATASAAVPLQVRNRLPLVQAPGGLGALELDHGVGPCPGGVGSCFLVEGTNPFVATDPDGDPLTAVTLVPGIEAGHSGSSAEALAGPGGGSFRFATPVAAPAEFRSATGQSGFWLTATASDPFGASAPAEPALPIRIRNRPPVLELAPGAATASHRYDASAASYLATAPLAAFVDPDGDPLDAAGSTGDESCGAFSLAGGVVSVACTRRYVASPTSYPTLSGFAGVHALVARARDGWDSVAAPASLTIDSTPPTVASYTGAIEACSCQCPLYEPGLPGVCAVELEWAPDAKLATFAVRPADADGDPLAVTFTKAPGTPAATSVSPAAWTGLPDTCGATISTAGFPVTVQVTANDGVSQASATWTATSVTCAKTRTLCPPGSLIRP